MEYKDYYKVLGLERSATQDEIKRAFRKLARKFRANVSKEPTAEVQFKEISEAYEVLGDAEKRAAYDQLGKEWKADQEFRPPPNWNAGSEFSGTDFEHGEFSDFFDALFGGMRRRERPSRREARFRACGEDHHARILIDLRDAFTGATRPISLRVPEVDDTGHVVLRDRILNVQVPKGITEGQHVGANSFERRRRRRRSLASAGPFRGRLSRCEGGSTKTRSQCLNLAISGNGKHRFRTGGDPGSISLPSCRWAAILCGARGGSGSLRTS